MMMMVMMMYARVCLQYTRSTHTRTHTRTPHTPIIKRQGAHTQGTTEACNLRATRTFMAPREYVEFTATALPMSEYSFTSENSEILEQDMEKYKARDARTMVAKKRNTMQQQMPLMHILLFLEPYVHRRFHATFMALGCPAAPSAALAVQKATASKGKGNHGQMASDGQRSKGRAPGTRGTGYGSCAQRAARTTHLPLLLL